MSLDELQNDKALTQALILGRRGKQEDGKDKPPSDSAMILERMAQKDSENRNLNRLHGVDPKPHPSRSHHLEKVHGKYILKRGQDINTFMNQQKGA